MKPSRLLCVCSTLALALCFITAGCTGLAGAPDHKETVILQPNALGLPLTEIWNIVLEKTGATNETAVLNSADIMVGADGSLEWLSLEFWDGKEDNSDFIAVDLRFSPGRPGSIAWSRIPPASETETVPVSLHPLDVLGELEQVDFADLHLGTEGLWIEVSGTRGSAWYGGGNYELGVLENGTFTPLREVWFTPEVQGCPIGIYGRGGQGGNITITETSAFLFWHEERTYTTYEEPDPERENIIAFVPESLAMADEVIRISPPPTGQAPPPPPSPDSSAGSR